MKEYVPVPKDCEHCSKKRGSFGCCSTVSNNWVYSCAEGQKEWVLGKIRAEIEQEYNRLRATRADETLELGECLGLKMSLKIIDKYKTGSEG